MTEYDMVVVDKKPPAKFWVCTKSFEMGMHGVRPVDFFMVRSWLDSSGIDPKSVLLCVRINIDMVRDVYIDVYQRRGVKK
jgi:hypothetical protein